MPTRAPNPRCVTIYRTFAGIALLGVTGWAFGARWQFLNASPHPFGIDGYYYSIQLRSLLAGEGLYYPSAPLAFYLMLPFTAFAEPISAVKLSAALWTSLAAVPAYLIVKRLTGERGAGLVAAALVAVSEQSFYLCTEFLKNGIGITLALACAASLGASLDDRSGHPARRIIPPLVLLGATYATHKAAFGLCVLFGLPPLAIWVVRRIRNTGDRVRRRRWIGWSAASVVCVSLVIVVAGLILPRRFVSPADLKLLPAATSVNAHDDALLLGTEVTYGAYVALALVGALAVRSVVRRLRGRVATEQAALAGTDPSDEPSLAARALVIGPIVYACVMAFPALTSKDPQGLTFRLRVMDFAALVICAPALLVHCVEFAPRLTRTAILAGAAAALLVFLPKTHAEGVIRTPQAWLPGVRALPRQLPPGSRIIVSSRQLAYMIKWETGLEATSHVPTAIDPERTYRLVDAGAPQSVECRVFEASLPAGAEPPTHPDPEHRWLFTLFPERTWRVFLDWLPAEKRAEVEPWCSR
jgi:hypothetical protein